MFVWSAYSHQCVLEYSVPLFAKVKTERTKSHLHPSQHAGHTYVSERLAFGLSLGNPCGLHAVCLPVWFVNGPKWALSGGHLSNHPSSFCTHCLCQGRLATASV